MTVTLAVLCCGGTWLHSQAGDREHRVLPGRPLENTGWALPARPQAPGQEGRGELPSYLCFHPGGRVLAPPAALLGKHTTSSAPCCAGGCKKSLFSL